MIVCYVYPMTCDRCADQSNSAIFMEPQVIKSISIQNATLIDVPSPSLVINLSEYQHILQTNIH